ncbi:hypothetical protein ACTHQ0_28710 [Priestia megaterium]|uniref:hypothetical protein n=1 Tax=Priestia megaterium TaxID=1404 RepID=UPI003F7F71FA
MWVITVYSNGCYDKMFEFEVEQEAKAAFKTIQGYKILTQVIYHKDHSINHLTPV